MGTTTPNFGMYLPAAGETGWATSVNANFSTIDANLTNALPRAYLAGCQLTNNAGAPNTKIDLSAGQAQDVGNAGAMTLAAITKDISATWVVGNGTGGLAAALSLLASTWYHLFVIKRTDTNVVDAYFDTSVTAANIPAPYTLFRRVGSVRTSGGSVILGFVQDGDLFQWKASITDLSTTNPGATAITPLLTVPTGVNVQAIVEVYIDTATSGNVVGRVSDLATTDTAPTNGNGDIQSQNIASNTKAAARLTTRTNTAAQIRYRQSASGVSDTLIITTVGWLDTRGKGG